MNKYKRYLRDFLIIIRDLPLALLGLIIIGWPIWMMIIVLHFALKYW
jgi:hypothetical protein